MNLLEIAGRSERLRRELARLDGRLADAVAALHAPDCTGARFDLVVGHLRWLRDRRRRIRLELDVLAEEAAARLGRDVARAPEAEPCPALAN